ncbi:MAG: RNA methyltransferase, partial [Pseudomonadota bacterium]
VQQGLDAGWEPETIVSSAEGLARPHIADLVVRASATGARVLEVPQRLLGQIARKDNPGAVLAAFRQRQLTFETLPRPDNGIWVGLYEVRDPGNLGTILRTADCAGIAGVILIGTCCDPYSLESVRASMGSIFDMPFVSADFEAFDTWRQGNALTLVAASVNGTARHDAEIYGKRCCLLMGNEQSGLPGEVEAACDTLCLIPMRGGADSLNLAQASAVMIYEAWRQQGFSGARDLPT